MNKPRIIIAVCGGIAAYKIPDLVSALKKNGYQVEVIQTPNSENFVTPASLCNMSDKYWSMDWGNPAHINVTKELTMKDAFVVVPATANTIAKLACGLGDNLVTDTALALPERTSKIVCPSMNSRMLCNNIVQRNIHGLKIDGWKVVEPADGLLACGTTGKGKLPSTKSLVESIRNILKDNKMRA